MDAKIISTGDELVRGRKVDTNASFVAAELGIRGFDVVRLAVVGDEPSALKAELLSASRDSALIVVSGGLGPTFDDRTRRAIAEAVGLELVEDSESRRHVADLLRSHGLEATESHLSQARFPAGATLLPNRLGTAWGFACRMGGAWVVAMPGVPSEMRAMFRESVLPFLEGAFPRAGCVRTETLHIFPAAESAVDERIADLSAEGRNPALGITVREGVVTLSLLARADDEDQADRLIRDDLRVLEERFGDLAFGRGGVTLASAVGEQLERSGLTIGVAESVTGGLVGHMLVDVPGISRVFLAGVVAYGNEAKVRQLGVPQRQLDAHGAVSPQVAESMARGICAEAGTALGLSTTGIAGPTGGSAEKPVGLVYVGVCLDGATRAVQLNLRGDRRRIKNRAAKHALNTARLALLKGIGSL